MNRREKGIGWGAACVVAVLLLAVPTPVAAYVGPGAGLAVIGAAIAFVGGVLLAIGGFVWYPVKRIVQRLRGDTEPGGDAER